MKSLKLLLCSIPLLAPAIYAQTAPKVDLKVRELMDAAVIHLQSLERFEMDYTLKVQGTPAPGQTVDEQFTSHIALQKPGSFSKVGVGEQGPMSPPSAYLHAGTAQLIHGDLAVVVKDLPTLKDFFISRDMGYIEEINLHMALDLRADLLRSMLTYNEKWSWDKDLVEASYKGEVEVDGQPAQHIQLKHERAFGPQKVVLVNDIWLTTGKEPLLIKVQESVDGEDSPMTFSGLYKNWKVNEAIDVTRFAAKTKAAKTFTSYDEYMGELNKSPAEALVGTAAPAIRLKRLDGSDFKLSDAKGKQIVILDFWATWCGPCVDALPELMAAAETYKDKDVILVAVNQQEEPKRISRFLEKQGWTLDVALDDQGQAGSLYKVQGIPQTVIIGKDGLVKVVHVGSGPGMREVIAQDLDKILAE